MLPLENLKKNQISNLKKGKKISKKAQKNSNITKKISPISFCYVRRLAFDQSSPLHPVSEYKWGQPEHHKHMDPTFHTSNGINHYTLNSTFEEKGELAVNSEKQANLLSIQRKRQIGCQFKERVD